jgi:alpha-mannosidase
MTLPEGVISAHIVNLEGQVLPSQVDNKFIYFLAQNIPSIGYQMVWLVPNKSATLSPDFPSNFILKNEAITVTIDPETGNISECRDNQHHRSILSGQGNQLQGFIDRGQYWDAWNIDPDYQNFPLPPTKLEEIKWVTYGELVKKIKVIRTLGNSKITQYYTLFAHENQLRITTNINWQERHTLLKVSFPLLLQANYISYEIPCGVIRRTTSFKTKQEQAKWEVPALNWADLTDENQDYGVSLIADYKSGYDPQPNQLRLSLLRGSTWPDPKADLGQHEFKYALYPHRGSWETAGTVQRGYEFNHPLQVYACPLSKKNNTGILPTQMTGLEFSSNSFILMAVKPSEDHPHHWIIRGYESQGKPQSITCKNNLALDEGKRINLLEEEQEKSSLEIQPWEILTLKCRQQRMEKVD